MSRLWGRTPVGAGEKSTPEFSRELSSPLSEEEELSTASEDMQVDFGENGKLVPTLTVLAGSSYNVGKTFRINRDEMIVGRWSTAAICLDDKGVSRRHAKLTCVGEGIFLTDLNSKNGTFCNGEKVLNRRLKDRDKIQLGTTTVLRFAYKEDLDEAVQKTLYESSTKDVLTDLYNKRFFLECLNKERAFIARKSGNLSLMMIDVDHFKRINDTYGHQAGDYVLSSVSREIGGMVRVDNEGVLAVRVSPRASCPGRDGSPSNGPGLAPVQRARGHGPPDRRRARHRVRLRGPLPGPGGLRVPMAAGGLGGPNRRATAGEGRPPR